LPKKKKKKKKKKTNTSQKASEENDYFWHSTHSSLHTIQYFYVYDTIQYFMFTSVPCVVGSSVNTLRASTDLSFPNPIFAICLNF
jgi:hypothetical protein